MIAFHVTRQNAIAVAAMGERVKIVIDLPPDNGFGGTAETVFAEHIGENAFRIQNIPGFADDINFNDIVEAKLDSDGRLHLVRVIVRANAILVRVLLREGLVTPLVSALVDALSAHSIAAEGAFEGSYRFYSLPSDDKTKALVDELDQARNAGLLDFEISSDPDEPR